MFTRSLKLPKINSFFLFGPRQTGKSTLVRHLFPQETTRRYNLLKTDEYLRLLADPTLLRKEIEKRPQGITHIFVDEIQKIPALLDEVHFVMEEVNNPPYFILTGSSARKLKRAQANLLGGRAWTLNLFPLTHIEIGESFDLVRALELGTLPKIYGEEDRESAHQYLKSYVETYLKEEIEAEALVRSSGTFLRFLYQAAHESGSLINYSAIAQATGTSSVTVKEYFKILEDTLVGQFLFPFHKSNRQRLAQHPKFILFDSGVQRALTKKLSLSLEPETFEFGKAFENWIIQETIRISTYLKKDFQFSYFRTERGAEVDLIIETPRGKTIAVEIKSSSSPRLAHLGSGFKALEQIIKPTLRICVCRIPYGRDENGIEMVPWKEFFERLQGWD